MKTHGYFEGIIETGDTRVKILSVDNELRVTELINKADGYNWIKSADGCVFPLMKKIRMADDNSDTKINWCFDAQSSSITSCGTGSKVMLVFENTEPHLILTSVWEAKDNQSGPVEHAMYIQNHSGRTVTVYQQESLDITLQSESGLHAWYVRKGSRTNNAFDNVRKDVIDACYNRDIFMNPHEGFNNFIPWLSLNDLDSSRGLYVGWEWPDGRINVCSGGKNTVHVKAGLGIPYAMSNWVPGGLLYNILEFKTDILNGQTFDVPKAFIGTFSGANTQYACDDDEKERILVDDGSNRLRKWLYKYCMPELNRTDSSFPEVEFSCNHCVGLLNPETPDGGQIGQIGNDGRKLPKVVNELKENGLDFDAICVDNGWPGVLGEYNNDPVYWPPFDENSDLPAMRQYAEMVYQNGFKRFQLYFAFHDGHSTEEGALSSYNTKGEFVHPEWFMQRQYDNPQKIKMPYYLLKADFGNADCLETTKKLMVKKLTEYNVNSIKLDFDPIIWDSYYQGGEGCKHKYGRLDTGYWSAKGFYELMDYLTDNIPGFKCQLNNCGGNLKDYASAKYGTVIPARDDLGYGMLPEHCRVALYQSLYCFPAMQLMVPFAGDHAVCGAYRYRSWMITAPFTMTEAPSDMSEEELNILRNCIRSYKEKVRPLVRKGDVFHILPDPCNDDWDGIEYYDDAGKGVAMLFKGTDRKGKVLNHSRCVKLCGLHPNSSYSLYFEDGSNKELAKRTYTGMYLMTEGLNLTLGEPDKIASEWMFFSKI